VSAVCVALGIAPVPQAAVTPARLLRGRVNMRCEVDSNFIEALKTTAQSRADFDSARMHDWMIFAKNLEVSLNFANVSELLASNLMEGWRGDDDRSSMFNPIANYQALIKAAVQKAPWALLLAHTPPILIKLLEAFFNYVDGITGLHAISPTAALHTEVKCPNMVPAIKQILGFSEAWPVWKCANDTHLEEVLALVDANSNGLIALNEATVFFDVLERLFLEQEASDLRDMYADDGIEVPVPLFAIPVALAAFKLTLHHLTGHWEFQDVFESGEWAALLEKDSALTPEQLAYGYELMKGQLLSGKS